MGLSTREICVGRCAVLVVTLLLFVESSHQNQIQEQTILRRILGAEYDPTVKPINGNASAPVAVSVSIQMKRIESLDDFKQEWSVYFTLRQQWQDDRLAWKGMTKSDFPYLSLKPENPHKKLWRPDEFLSIERNLEKADGSRSSNEFYRIYSNGDVILSSSLSMTTSCPMDLRRFPHDTQTCSIRMSSYGYTTADVSLTWKQFEPLQVRSNPIPQKTFELKSYQTEYCNFHTNAGSYSCLLAKFEFSRAFQPYLLQVYIPSAMLVLVSFLSFWISKEAVTARVVLPLITLLALAFQTSEANKKFPFTSYKKVVDVWTGVCLTFVFATLLEFVAVHYSTLRRNRRNVLKISCADEEVPLEQENVNSKTVNRFPLRKLVTRCQSFAGKLDLYSRVLFPVAFLLFVICYWAKNKKDSLSHNFFQV